MYPKSTRTVNEIQGINQIDTSTSGQLTLDLLLERVQFLNKETRKHVDRADRIVARFYGEESVYGMEDGDSVEPDGILGKLELEVNYLSYSLDRLNTYLLRLSDI
jgi:hypothetical protein